MGILQVSSTILPPTSQSFNYVTKPIKFLYVPAGGKLSPTTRRRLCAAAAETATASSSPEEAASPEEPPSIDFAFVHSRLLPDGMPDIAIRPARGGRKLRDIMLDCHVDLYGPYDKPLSNCSGGGTCGTCLVEVVDGKEFLSPRTDKEKELLKRKPKSWRLACQTTVGNQDSRGQVVIQQLPEWKTHEWE
ncbi:photosynthetic NDH subunit of subcomplex B 3, chloroplastic [Iris pallida]|uniref:Photosynthetic NDH subunit of subcomplex B 3, chloroplastic n=1 Tax=Iris pallida TaxID=29817 RepID=A0AAX6G7S9_IRIPA|nr:photosynthetic NDH subunit of subcomplex B 3, chloroplastic [Iris pallida]